MRRWLVLTICALALALPVAASAHLPSGAEDLSPKVRAEMYEAQHAADAATASGVSGIGIKQPLGPGSFEQVGHDPLLSRGMNSAPAVHGDHVYVGSRTDGTHLNAGVLVVDVSDPADPEVVNEIGAPEEGNVGESSRELRVWPEQDLLMVLNHGCSELIHRCAGSAAVKSNYKFYDISGANAADPKLVSTYFPTRSGQGLPHEFFLWDDPQREGRALLYQTTTSRSDGSRENLIVTDISGARDGEFEEIGTWTAVYPPGDPPDSDDNRLHSLSTSFDGRRGYLAYLGGGFLVVDTSDFADAEPRPEVRLITPVANRADWGDPGAHTAVKLFGRPYTLMTDEVYGKFGGVLAEHGCPWGWSRVVDIRKETKPKVVAEYRVAPQNTESYCDSVPPDQENFSSQSAHNPTLTPNMALITWHSRGLQAVSLENPRKPQRLAEFMPEPLPSVQTEDPALSSGRDKVVMWSYPIVKDGLIYVVDLRNGLYILRYHGRCASELASAGFLEGNSNLGDWGRFEAQGPGSGCVVGDAAAGGAASTAPSQPQPAPAAEPPRRPRGELGSFGRD